MLHVDSVLQEEVVEGDREEHKGSKYADDDPDDSILYSILLRGYPCTALTMLLMKFHSMVKMINQWHILRNLTVHMRCYGT